MKFREIGNSGIKAPVVAFGAWAIGAWMWGGNEEQESINALRAISIATYEKYFSKTEVA